tara:strand:- start:1296 stop:3509 length:2214 start_codon:yes stop_codon:yes gene_type:complete
MATISIADNDARKQYTQAVTANSTQLTIDFPFFSLDDINVIVTNTSGVDTTLSRGTGTGTFAVTGAAVDDGFSGGDITLGDTYPSGTKFTIFRDITIERTTDFPTSGPFNVSALNTELDKIFAIEQELETKVSRTMKLADSDTAASLTLPNLDTRKGTTLAFNETSGLPEAGPSIASVGTVSQNVANINTVAGVASDITTVAGQISPTNNINTVAGVAGNVTTVAGVASSIPTVANIASNVTTVAGIDTAVSTVAGIQANVTTVAGINTTHLANVSGVASNVALLGTADAVSDLNTLAAISTDITSLADSLEKTYTVTVANPGSGNVFVLDGVNNPAIEMFRGNTYIFDVSDSSVSGHPLAFKDGSGNSWTTGVTTTGTAGQAGAKVTFEVPSTAPSSMRYYCTVHGNGMGNTITVKDSNISLVAGSIANINTVAGIQSNVTTVAGIQANVTTVAGIDTEVQAVANNQTNVNNVGGSISNVNLVGGSIASVNTAANNLSAINAFANIYLGPSASAPTADPDGSALDIGDLYFDTNTNTLKVYAATGWVSAGSSVNGTSNRSDFVVGTASGGYNGSTTVFPITYDAGFVDVYLNGIKLQPADFTATNGTSVTLLSAAQTNDTVSLVAFGTFNVANFSINDANDVTTSGVSNGQVLAFNSSTSDFEPTTISSDLVSDTSPQLGGTLDTNGQAIQFGSSKWTIELSGDNLLFKYNGTAKIKFASDGEIVSVDDVTAFGTI